MIGNLPKNINEEISGENKDKKEENTRILEKKPYSVFSQIIARSVKRVQILAR